jgi:SEC-C motif-containing protein
MGKKLTVDGACPCESGRAYAACCGLLHAGAAAPDPEALMRSRYTAYVLGLEPYLLSTWHPSTRPAQIELGADRSVQWLGLRLLGSRMLDADHATVTFVARYRVGGGSAVRLQEASRFERAGGRWCYVDGDVTER